MTDKPLEEGDVVIRHGVRYVVAHTHNADGQPSLVVEGVARAPGRATAGLQEGGEA